MNEVRIFGRKPIPLLLSLLLLAGCATGYYYIYQVNTQLKPVLPPLAAERHLQQWLHHLPDELMSHEPLHHLDLVRDIYRRGEHRLLWLDNYELSAAGKNLLRQLRDTSADELIDYRYHLAYLQQRLHRLPTRPSEATAVDILLTDAFVTYAEDVLNEQLLPKNIIARQQQNALQNVSLDNNKAPPATINGHDKHHIITSLITENDSAYALNKMMDGLEPQHAAYQTLRQALEHYQTIAASYEWWPLENAEVLQAGDNNPHVGHLRSLLKLYGDYPLPQESHIFDWFSKKSAPPEVTEPNIFDDDLVASLKHFQQRHGLVASGRVDSKTRERLNVSPSHRIKQIALNMKRWRELPEDLGDRYIRVNLTDYHLDVIEHDRSIMDMRVIVGKTSRRTPVMYEDINSIVLNPQWNVPRRIMVRDILPKVKEDPRYLTERNIRIINGWQEQLEVPLEQIDLNAMPLSRFPYRLQQDPGEDNALGVVKFVIPNDESIYLHDTNSRDLFGEHYRALSSGCVRVEKPLELVELLLQGKRGWTRNKIDAVLAKGETTYVKLPESIPTYLVYWTAWVDDRGRIHFRDDIYREDQVLQTAERDLESLIL